MHQSASPAAKEGHRQRVVCQVACAESGTLYQGDKGRAPIVSVQEVREGPSEKVTVIHV